MKQPSKRKNGVVIVLGGIHKSSAKPDARGFRVMISGNIPTNTKEEILGNLRDNIAICWHGEKVDQVIKEEDI